MTTNRAITFLFSNHTAPRVPVRFHSQRVPLGSDGTRCERDPSPARQAAHMSTDAEDLAWERLASSGISEIKKTHRGKR